MQTAILSCYARYVKKLYRVCLLHIFLTVNLHIFRNKIHVRCVNNKEFLGRYCVVSRCSNSSQATYLHYQSSKSNEINKAMK